MRNLMIEIGLMVCVNCGSLYKSQLHRLLEYEWMLIEINRIDKSVKKWESEEFFEKYGE